MKTAMQELFEYWDTQNNPLTILNWIASNEKRLLEKEKEQLLNAFIDDSWNKSFNEYYNQTYNKYDKI